MTALKLIVEGLGLGFLLYLVCAVGIRNGAVGLVHLYDPKVQERVVALGLTTSEEIRKRSARFKCLCLPGYLIYVLACVIIPGTEDLRPYITAKDKQRKWIMGTVGMALIAAILSGIMALILK